MRQGGFGGGRGFGGPSRDFGQSKMAPVKVGEEVDVTIEAVGAKGDGVAKKEGFVIFVPGTSQGENVRIRITKVLANVAFAEVAGKSSGTASKARKSEQEGENTGADAYKGETEQPVDTENFGEEE
ncbi:TPA: TRAM domain-containing protein [Candidatus Woesearchaeota archaeon]|nr:TRAM domain-containing protein [Candidatus Woesearchaeota archaeon]